MSDIKKLWEYVDGRGEFYVKKLELAVAIKSVSADPKCAPQLQQMAEWLVSEIKALNGVVVLRELNPKTLPKVVLARFGEDSSKPTVLIYGHYDVQPATMADGWFSDPFKLMMMPDRRLVGRGATDDKGPVLCWLWALEAFRKLDIKLPVNVLLCIEGMEESGSVGLREMIVEEADKWFSMADCVCISDSYWLGTAKPCITYGLRGICYFCVTVFGPTWDLHSGVFGGVVREPMTDLIALLGSIVDGNGEILVPGIYDTVDECSEKELQQFKQLDFSLSDLHQAVGNSSSVLQKDQVECLKRRWQKPSLSIHGISGAFSEEGQKTVIPCKVTGKFSIRLVPSQTPEDIQQKVVRHLTSVFKLLNSPNTFSVDVSNGARPWVADTDHWNYKAARNAIRATSSVDPDLIREGGSIPVTLDFQEILKKNVLLLPIGRSDDGAHSVSEKIDLDNYIYGIKLFISYLYEVACWKK